MTASGFRRRRRVSAAFLLGALCLAACSSDGDGAGTGSSTSVASSESTDSEPPEPADSGVDTAPAASDAPTAATCELREPGDEHEVVIWHSLRLDASVKFDEQIARFNSLRTGVTVVAESVGGYSEVVSALIEAAPEDRPDLVMLDQRGVRSLHDSNLFLPPTACEGGAAIVDGLVPVIGAAYEVDGEVAAFPYNVSTPVLMYNATTLRAAGLDPANPPATLDELTAASIQVQASGAATYGFVAHDTYGPWFVMQYNARTGLVSGEPDNGRGDFLIDRVEFTNDETVEAFEWLQEEITVGRALWIGSNISGANDLFKLVDLDDNAAFTMSTSASTGDILHLLAIDSFPGAELGVAPLPGPGTAGGLVGGSAIWMTAQPDAMQAGAAFELLDWLMAPQQHAEFAAFTGYSPVRDIELDEQVLIDEWATHPQLRVGYDQLATLDPTAVWAGPAWGPGDEIHSVLYAAITQIA